MTTGRRGFLATLGLCVGLCAGCTGSSGPPSQGFDPTRVVEEVETALWAFHAADTARSAEGVISLLWPEYSMLGDGARLRYPAVAAGSREFMAGLSEFHTEWSDIEIIPLGPDAAIKSFLFRDSILSQAGDLTLARGREAKLNELVPGIACLRASPGMRFDRGLRT